MKKNRKLFQYICLCVVCCLLSSFPVDATDIADKSVTQGCRTLDAATTLIGQTQLIENCTAALLYERNSDTLMYAWNADSQVYPASLVKIVTAIIAIEKGNLTDAIVVTDEVLSLIPSDAASCDLVVDEIMTLHDLLYCMMVDSANDAAAVIAQHISGSQENFISEMNALAQSLGCTGTQFRNVHGLHDDEQFTTARDISRILLYALKNETFQELFTTVDYIVPATNKSEARSLVTGNYLISNANSDNVQLYYDSRVTGGRTGVTDSGERCILSTAQQDNLSLICVVMGAKSEFDDFGRTKVYGGYSETSDLLDIAFDGYQMVQVLYDGQVLDQISVRNGDCALTLGTKSDLFTVLPDGITTQQLTFRFTNTGNMLEAPIRNGDNVSDLEIWNGSMCIGQAELYAMNNVSHAQDGVREEAPVSTDDNTVEIVILVILAVSIVAFLVYIATRYFGSLRRIAVRGRSKKRKSVRKRR